MTINPVSRQIAINKCQELAALVNQHTDNKGNGAHATAINSLIFMRECDPSTTMHGVSEPMLAIVVQGKKAGVLNEELYQYGVAQYLVVSVALPLSGCVVEASPDQPYLG